MILKYSLLNLYFRHTCTTVILECRTQPDAFKVNKSKHNFYKHVIIHTPLAQNA